VNRPFGAATAHPEGPHEALTLAVGDISYTVVPALAMLGVSLAVAGTAVMGLHRPLSDYVDGGEVVGMAVLHPWANRLGADRFAVTEPATGATVDVDVATQAIARDPAGLVLHGMVGPATSWQVAPPVCGSGYAEVSAVADLGTDGAFMAAWPFPHRVAVTQRLEATGTAAGVLHVTVTVEPTGEVAVPLCGGWHPYFCVAGVARRHWELGMPPVAVVELDGDGLPTGVRTRQPGGSAPLGDRLYDDGFVLVAPAPARRGSQCDPNRTFILAGGGTTIGVEMGAGYDAAQVYAPGDHDVVAIEPMMAVTDAVRHGDHRWAHPGQPATAWFAVWVDTDAGGA
jgi:aldose 1-epimerase